jgi:hypothetical protein
VLGRKPWVLIGLLAGLLFTAEDVSAQQDPAFDVEPGWREVRAGSFSPLDPFHAGFGIGSGVGWLTNQAASYNHVRKSGPTFHLDVDADVFDLVTLGGSLGTIFLKDDGQFKQTVINTEGDVYDAESSLNLTQASLFTGLRTPDYCLAANQKLRAGWVALYAFTRVGYTWLGAGRAIAQCIDCREDTLSTPGGVFVEPGVSLGLKANDGIGMSLVTGYRGYPSGASVAGELRIAIMFHYW